MVYKKITGILIAATLVLCGLSAAAQTVLQTSVLPSGMELGQTYGNEIFEGTNFIGNADGAYTRVAEDTVAIGTKEGKPGGMLRYRLNVPVCVGRIAVDFKVKRTEAQTTARNVLLLRADSTMPLVYTTVLSRAGHLTRCQQTVNGSWFDYVNEAEFYELRAVLERPRETEDWQLALYEKENGYDEPIFTQQIASSELPQLSYICFENYKLTTADTESLLTVGGISISSLPTASASTVFTDAEGKTVTDLSQTSRPVAAASLVSHSAFTQNITLRLAQYEGQSLIGMAQKTVLLAPGETLRETIALPENTVYLPQQRLKLFVWSDALSPQSAAGTILCTGTLRTAGSGDSLWLEVAAEAWLNGTTVTCHAFTVTASTGEEMHPEQVLYDPIRQTVRLQIAEIGGLGTYAVQSHGLLTADGANITIDKTVLTTAQYDVPLYTPSVQSVQLYRDGAQVFGITADGTYEVRMQIVGLTPNQHADAVVYRRRGNKTEWVAAAEAEGGREPCTVSVSLAAKTDDVVFVVLR